SVSAIVPSTSNTTARSFLSCPCSPDTDSELTDLRSAGDLQVLLVLHVEGALRVAGVGGGVLDDRAVPVGAAVAVGEEPQVGDAVELDVRARLDVVVVAAEGPTHLALPEDAHLVVAVVPRRLDVAREGDPPAVDLGGRIGP